MPRKQTLIFPGSAVHSLFRVYNREFLFNDSLDHQIFIEALKRQKLRYQVKHFAWVGMSNHHHVFHLTPEDWHTDTAYGRRQKAQKKQIHYGVMNRDSLSFFCKQYNEIHNREGGLLKDRTKSIPIGSDSYALILLFYRLVNIEVLCGHTISNMGKKLGVHCVEPMDLEKIKKKMQSKNSKRPFASGLKRLI